MTGRAAPSGAALALSSEQKGLPTNTLRVRAFGGAVVVVNCLDGATVFVAGTTLAFFCKLLAGGARDGRT